MWHKRPASHRQGCDQEVLQHGTPFMDDKIT